MVVFWAYMILSDGTEEIEVFCLTSFVTVVFR